MSLFKDKLYDVLVRKNGRVWYEYERYVNEHMEEHRRHRFNHIKVLLELNWFYRIKKGNSPYLYWDVPLTPVCAKENNNNRLYPECLANKRESIDDLIRKIKEYDVICFDCFDTLLFRVLENPDDLFYLMEIKYQLPEFKKIRKEALKEARKKKETGEVTLEEIYECIVEKYSNLVTAEDEFNLEKEVTYANTYMLSLIERLLNLNKEIVCVSDMYLNNNQVLELLVNAGFPTMNVFTSSSEGVDKKNGLLQAKVIEKLGKEKKYFFIGDNYNSDFIQSNYSGMHAYWYRNCNEIGKAYRSIADKSLTGSVYKSIVNNYLHCGTNKNVNPYYEHGFAYGGIIAYGFCEFIEKLRERDHYDKFIFLARDMNVFYKVYKKYFNTIDSEYVAFSRFASQQLIFEYFPEEYITYTVFTRRKKNTISETLAMYDLPEFKEEIISKGLDGAEQLTDNNFPIIKEIIFENKDKVIRQFKPSVESAKTYYKKYVGISKNICILDLGWKGTAVVYLSRLFKEWGWNVNVHGAIVSISKNAYAQSVKDSKLLDVYMNRNEIDFKAGVPANSNFEAFRGHMFEMTFTSTEASLLEFGEKEELIYARENPNKEVVEQIQNGIIDFCYEFKSRTSKISKYFEISGFSANTPINKALKTISYMVPVWAYVLDEASSEPGFAKEPKYKTFFQFMKQCKLVRDEDLNNNFGVIDESDELYICSTYSHLLITIITILTEKKNNVDIILYDDLPNCSLLKSKLRTLNIFNNIIIFTKGGLPQRFHKEENDKIKLMEYHYVHLVAVEKKLPIDISKYKNVYTFYDGHHLGLYLQEKHIKYHLIEDGMNHFQHIMATPSVQEIPVVNSETLKGYMQGSQYLCCGQNPDCLSIEVNDNHNLAINHNNIIEKPRKNMISKLSIEQKNAIFNVFINDFNYIKNIGNNLAIVFTSVLVNDGWVDNEKTQIKIYRDIVTELINDGYYVILKPHPRDKVMYTKEFRDCYVLDKNFPSELLDFKEDLHFKKGIVIASSAMELIDCIEHKEKLGFKHFEKYKDHVAPWILESLEHPDRYNW